MGQNKEVLWLFTVALLVAIPLVKMGVDKIRWAFRYGGDKFEPSEAWCINNNEHD